MNGSPLSINEKITITPSNIFIGSLLNSHTPRAISFIISSIVNITVKKMLSPQVQAYHFSLGSGNQSVHRTKVLKIINIKTIVFASGLITTQRKLFHHQFCFF